MAFLESIAPAFPKTSFPKHHRTKKSFYFRLYPGAIKSPQIIAFLQHLMRHVAGPLLVVWDGLPSHRSRLVRDSVADTEGRLVLERLPAYAPELNPIEYLKGSLEAP